MAALEMLAKTGNTATFFTCGWVASNYPELLREVIAQGHEVACQSYFPKPVRDFDYDTLKEDIERSRDVITQATGVETLGFRVGRGWIGASQLWVLNCLAELGFSYDSSLCGIGRQFANRPDKTVLHTHATAEGDIVEVPVSSYKLAGLYLPVAGGNYVRQIPWRITSKLAEHWIAANQQPLVTYFHVWELDKDQPTIDAAHWLQRIRHYRNLQDMTERIGYYLNRYQFTSIAEHLQLTATPVQCISTRAQAEGAQETNQAPEVAAQTRIELTIATPCYNEEATLTYLHKTLHQFEQRFGHLYRLNLLFVDDGSHDQTWQKLHTLFAEDKRCILVQHPENRGIAAAILTAIEHAPTEFVAIIDADCTFDPMQLPDLMVMMDDDIDLVAASPLHPDGEMANVPGWRLLMSKGAALLYRLVLHHRFASYTSCFRVYRRSKVLPMQLLDNGFSGVTEILARMDLNGARIAECPATLEVRLLGQSKINTLRTIADHLRLVLRIAIARITGNPLATSVDRNAQAND